MSLPDSELVGILLLTAYAVGAFLGVEAGSGVRTPRLLVGVGVILALIAFALRQVLAFISRPLLPFGLVLVGVEAAAHALFGRTFLRGATGEVRTALRVLLYGGEGMVVATILGVLGQEPGLVVLGVLGGYATGMLLGPEGGPKGRLSTLGLIASLAAAAVLSFRLAAPPP